MTITAEPAAAPLAVVHIVDDDAAVRHALTMLLEQHGLAVRAFDGAESFLQTVDAATRGCAVVDVYMPGMDGLQLQAEITARALCLPVVFLTGKGDIAMGVQAVKRGAINFLTKPARAGALLENVQEALREGARLHAEHSARGAARARLATLTEREREVMALAVRPLSNKQIALELCISHRTVEIHKTRVMEKTGARSLLELLRLAESIDKGQNN
jgi:FixJ family two-component response regulator